MYCSSDCCFLHVPFVTLCVCDTLLRPTRDPHLLAVHIQVALFLSTQVLITCTLSFAPCAFQFSESAHTWRLISINV